MFEGRVDFWEFRKEKGVCVINHFEVLCGPIILGEKRF